MRDTPSHILSGQTESLDEDTFGLTPSWLRPGEGFEHPAMDVLRLAVRERIRRGEQCAPAAIALAASDTSIYSLAGDESVDIDETVRGKIKLPTAPEVIGRLQEAFRDPLSTAQDIADIIASCPKLTASILRIANSPLYLRPRRVDTLRHAVALLGASKVSVLAIGSAVRDMFKSTGCRVVDEMSFWKHGIACGVLSYNIAVMLDRPEPERFYVAGLLHDMGKLALYGADHARTNRVRDLSRDQGATSVQAERAVFTVDHAILGKGIFEHWGLPSSVALAAEGHHSPGHMLMNDAAAIVHIADVAATAFGYPCDLKASVQPFEANAWTRLNLSPSILHDLAASVDVHVEAFLEA